MPVLSAGLVLHRRTSGGVELLVAHMGGPFWARKDEGAWSFPKGVVEPGEEPLDAARRELTEELGVPAPEGPFVPLGEVRQSGKTVVAWAVEADLDPDDVVPGTFEMEWPPRSGRTQAFPEVDRVAWVGPEDALRLLVKAQRGFVPRVLDAVGAG
ncbi:NUDIX domain-containing protein [Aeromicrobium sp. IC_218]|uniref:NUDIX domain-containing protein n=1 Tax=Aeromicrobium sp. IC_218 TaxID=2545468 RepID=UPI00103CF8F9|nr:NUDIX domain-containing protein [Aeromicrobium sp. IC_218]TCI97735.1 NUDIX domain-containing protein [Aeromicrobium sp. IC_218]